MDTTGLSDWAGVSHQEEEYRRSPAPRVQVYSGQVYWNTPRQEGFIDSYGHKHTGLAINEQDYGLRRDANVKSVQGRSIKGASVVPGQYNGNVINIIETPTRFTCEFRPRAF